MTTHASAAISEEDRRVAEGERQQGKKKSLSDGQRKEECPADDIKSPPHKAPKECGLSTFNRPRNMQVERLF